jgi:hypothetical protein
MESFKISIIKDDKEYGDYESKIVPRIDEVVELRDKHRYVVRKIVHHLTSVNFRISLEVELE